MKFKVITPAHAYYRNELMLRWELLRKPLGMPPGSEVIPEEKECLHLLVMDLKKVVGCLVFHPDTHSTGTLKQVALSHDCGGHGFGRKVVHALEIELIKKGITEIQVFAPKDLEGFYESCGFHAEGEVIDSTGLLALKMKKHVVHEALKSA
ncbi:MAG: N-acetyltransferase [Chlamydiae bacterium]|nr:N-acetyltransferase [Chlamydiota bacterium]